MLKALDRREKHCHRHITHGITQLRVYAKQSNVKLPNSEIAAVAQAWAWRRLVCMRCL